jgi:hypothetical protein
MNGTEMNGKVTGSEPVDEQTMTRELSLINIPASGFSVEKEIQEIEKGVELFNRIKIVALKLTKPTDWVDQGASMYLMDRGAENIAIAFGVDIGDVKLTMDWAEDAKGRYYTYVANGRAYSRRLGRSVEDFGVCSQRDKFFGMASGKLKEIEDVDAANIRRKAVTNLYNRLIKRVVGLSGVTIEDLKASGMDVSKIGKIEYQGGGQKGAASLSEGAKSQREIAEKQLAEMFNADPAQIKAYMEKISEFEADGGKKFVSSLSQVKSEKWMARLAKQIDSDFQKHMGQ